MGNGALLVTLDESLCIRDLYFPHAGMENHVGGHNCRFGVSINGTFFWIDSSWQREIRYSGDTLVTNVVFSKLGFPLMIAVNDAVHPVLPLFLRKISLENPAGYSQDIRIFLAHDFHVLDIGKGNTAYFHPGLGAVIHYKKNRFLLVGGSTGNTGITQYAVGLTEFASLAGAWADAEDGELSGNPVAHGLVDSVIALHTRLAPGGTAVMTSWICAGKSLGEIASRQAFVRRSGVEALLRQTEAYHHLWVRSGRTDTGGLPAPVADLFTRSLLIIRSHVDNHGGIIASCDSDIQRLSHDTYNYVWPRDGAFAARVLDAAGYHDITRKFYSFCRDSLTGEGFLMQKYNPDGSWGSTSHSSVGVRGEEQLPIQEDETALVLFTLWQHYAHAGDTEFVLSLYEPLICRAADFLVRYRDEQTDLPHPSYDLWEENFGIFTFTASAVYGGLVAAAQFAGIFGETDRAERYARAASEIRDDILRHLWDPEAGRFVKSIRPTESCNYVWDLTVDASAFGICEFGVLPAGHKYVARTMTSVESALWVKTKIGGCARYEKDNYQRVGDDYAAVPGNPWPVCTLWLARWHIATGDMVRGMELLSWTVNRASQAGHLAEQLDPYHGIPLSVSPLMWSHAAFAETVIRYREKMRGLATPQKGFDGNTGVPPVSPGMTKVIS